MAKIIMNMELTKKDTQMAKGIAILAMVMLHLFCRRDNLPYTPLIWFGDLPMIYYLGLFGDLCVPVYCFCSGYAHYLIADRQQADYPKRIPGKALRFLANYWIVLILFSGLGLIFDKTGRVPGGLSDFIGNLLIYNMNYNGAWWFVSTYLLLLLMSPALAALTKKLNGIVLISASFGLYFAAYVLRFKLVLTLSNPVLQWLWNQMILLGTSQFGYFAGMICRRYGLIGMLREQLKDHDAIRLGIVFGFPLTAFLAHCVVNSAFVAPFTAAAVLIALFLVKLPEWAEKLFLLFGAHSTNIWLVHMFFYASLFADFVFIGKYPLFILALMLAVCFASSAVIERIYRRVLLCIERLPI